ncbi:nuclear transport factor 2 family protein [Kribbella sp. NPDC026596]|uniref:nuclear transport factor 2 family protein n=1 Tax=Kribbella sp. NPDC026596 TaxID=3155122 RepID=UPI00340E5698
MTENTVPETDTGLLAVQRYVDFWNASTEDEQQRLATTTFATTVAYHAPVGVLHGVDELIGFRDQFADHSPNYRFETRTLPQAHHGRARLEWELTVDKTSFATGTDVLELDEEGRIVAIAGFLDRAPDGFPH